MSLIVEKTRLAGEIDSYLKGKHDADKANIARVCRLSVTLAITFTELLNTLTAFRNELTVLVGKKNAHRWFSHSAGKLDTILAKGIERCTGPAANERGLAMGMKKAPLTTIKDWNRNSGGTDFAVNDRKFTLKTAGIEDIRAFLREAGINNQNIRDFVCDYFNQDALLGMGHAFGLVIAKETGLAPNFDGAYHAINTKSSNSVACIDRANFSSLISLQDARMTSLKPSLQFITTFDLLDNGRDVLMSDVEYSLGNLTSVPKELQPKIQAAVTKINSVT